MLFTNDYMQAAIIALIVVLTTVLQELRRDWKNKNDIAEKSAADRKIADALAVKVDLSRKTADETKKVVQDIHAAVNGEGITAALARVEQWQLDHKLLAEQFLSVKDALARVEQWQLDHQNADANYQTSADLAAGTILRRLDSIDAALKKA